MRLDLTGTCTCSASLVAARFEYLSAVRRMCVGACTFQAAQDSKNISVKNRNRNGTETTFM